MRWFIHKHNHIIASYYHAKRLTPRNVGLSFIFADVDVVPELPVVYEKPLFVFGVVKGIDTVEFDVVYEKPLFVVAVGVGAPVNEKLPPDCATLDDCGCIAKTPWNTPPTFNDSPETGLDV